jgi:hypothetical protein
VMLSAPASLLARLHGLFPGATTDLLGWVNKFVLPAMSSNGRTKVRGADVEPRTSPFARTVFSKFGRFAEPTPKIHTEM